MSINIDQFWAQCIQRGLFPLAIARGSKAPIGAGWPTWTTPVPHPGAGGVGLRCGGPDGLTAFDVDCDDADLSGRLLNAFRQVLGPDIPVRYGRRPRFLIPFFLDGQVRGHTYKLANGDLFQLIGGQFIAHGEHKDTGQPYTWEHFDSRWPRLTQEQFLQVLSEVPARAGTSIRFGTDHETCSETELTEALPRDQGEFDEGRRAAVNMMSAMTTELRGKADGRGSTIFALAGVLKFAERAGICSRAEIENAVISAGHSLDEGLGGRTLGQEIERHDALPVLRGNLIMSAIMNRRTMVEGLRNAQQAPSMTLRTGRELKLKDTVDELPWLFYQRILGGEVHLISGHSGAGKSTVVSDLCVHYLKNAAWLGAECERTEGHVVWVAAEDDYGTDRRMRYLLRNEPNAQKMADRFHTYAVQPGLAFEQGMKATVEGMKAMGMRVDLIVLDTWSASGLCFADNDTEAVAKAMSALKRVAGETGAALLVTDHLPLGGEDTWQKGNGAKSGNSGFVYRVTRKDRDTDLVSIDCGKARGCPTPKSYAGRVVSEDYGMDRKGRMTTVNVFKPEPNMKPAQAEQHAALQLAALLMGVHGTGGMVELRAGEIVLFENVASDLGGKLGGNLPPKCVMNKDVALRRFKKDGFQSLSNAGYLKQLRGGSFLAVYDPSPSSAATMTSPWSS